MANNNSTKKRVRQAEKSRLKNAKIKSSVRTASKKLLKLINAKEEVSSDALLDAQKTFVKRIDNAARYNLYHWKTAARLKSRMAKKVNAIVK